MSNRLSISKRDSLTGFAFTLPAIVGLLVFFFIPFCISIYLSLTSGLGGTSFVGLQNYAEVIQSNAFKLAAGNTLKFNVIAVPLNMILSFCIALLLYQKLKGSHFFQTVFIFPLVLPTASVIMFFQIIFHSQGAANSLLELMGFPIVDWLNSPHAFTVLVILYLWKNCGYSIILFLTALNGIPKDLYEAADVDGVSETRKLFQITIPLIAPSSFFIFVISLMNSFKVFREAYILCGEHPHNSIYMLQHFMNNNFQNLNYQRLSVSAILIFLVIFILIFFVLRSRYKKGDTEL